ncbi:hypothetical protein BDQ12DRAFT_683328 [Crucibulum laeve]|uniref:Uncharacterized protein n=1 Tax=Crucibulum laeve TaxID=68775 RepID=A0A5C3MCA6_9AGAR|nr:hypothetical protein BDQ12DRAFT_683328 [Crucibulum laeve]
MTMTKKKIIWRMRKRINGRIEPIPRGLRGEFGGCHVSTPIECTSLNVPTSTAVISLTLLYLLFVFFLSTIHTIKSISPIVHNTSQHHARFISFFKIRRSKSCHPSPVLPCPSFPTMQTRKKSVFVPRFISCFKI